MVVLDLNVQMNTMKKDNHETMTTTFTALHHS